MKIYFGASVSAGRKYLKQSQLIVKTLKELNHNKILSEHVTDPQLVPGHGLDPQKLFNQQIQTLAKADLMIAEVTQPSWGTAFLMEHALENGIPVLALFYKDNHGKLSLMVEGHPQLYTDHYNEDNLKTVLKKNLDYFKDLKKQKGKLIVIDGTNGSGKATQTEQLIKYFKKHRIHSKQISFPRYYSSFHGKTVGRFLKGEFGGLNEVNPHLSSLAYALDRLTARDEIVDWLKDGNMVVADRYVTASMAHQAIKVPPRQRQDFLRWLYQMEYKEHHMPKEDIVIYLYVPPEISDKLILQKAKVYRGKKKRDIEEGLEYQRKVTKQYLRLVKKYDHWVKIDCTDKQGKLLSIKKVHQKVLQALKKAKII